MNWTRYRVSAVLTFLFTLVSGQAQDEHKTTKTLTLALPACPIKAATIPVTTTALTLPKKDPLREAFSVVGFIQVTDQSGATVFLTSDALAGDLTHVTFARTVKSLGHATGQLTFDRGCISTDPYGSNNCSWTWGESITAKHQGVLQEDIQAGKLIVSLTVDNTIPVAFSCPVCGSSCAVTIPKQLDQGKWDDIRDLLLQLMGFPLGLVFDIPAVK